MFFAAFSTSLKALHANKVRTALAVLGVTIGITTIIIVFSAGAGLESIVVGEIESFGVDAIQVEIKVPSSKKGLASEQQSATALLQGAQITTLNLDDLDDVFRQVPNIEDGYGLFMTQEAVTFSNQLQYVFVMATNASFINIDQTQVMEGRYFSDSEDKSLSQVVVLGANVRKDLFGDSNPIGRSIQIRDKRFRVIGVMEERGSVAFFDFDDFVYVPLRTLQKKIAGTDFVHNLIFKVDDLALADVTSEHIRSVLRVNHNISPPEDLREGWADTGTDDFRVVTMEELRDIIGSVTSSLTILLLAIVAISLVVGGVGVMNVMYVIVNERTPEIGLRKAVGATYSNIMMQFLAESILITLIGSIVGIIFGVLISYGMAIGASSAGLTWRFIIPPSAFITALFFSIVFGVLFGLYPARKAARLDPVEALRSRQ
jgi:putative ABC transport system permease protein